MTDAWVKATGSWFDGWGISALPSLGSPQFLHQCGTLSLQIMGGWWLSMEGEGVDRGEKL